MKYLPLVLGLAVVAVSILAPELAHASVESSLNAIYSRFVGTILPIVAAIGLVIAGFSFVMGHENARSHLILAIIGAAIGFGASSIVSFIRGLVH